MLDPLWKRVFLGVHITAGSGAFLLAPLALVTAKGGKAHRLWGKIYSGPWRSSRALRWSCPSIGQSSF
jgi:hypothetical protein